MKLEKRSCFSYHQKHQMENNEYYRYCHREKRTHIEILHDFSTSKIPIGYLIQLICLQKPREFSIACSPSLYPTSIHLTVGILRYKTTGHKRVKIGLWSAYLASSPAHPILCYIKSGSFYLPSTETPLVLICCGTGIAAFRGHIQERQQTPLPEVFPNTMLFFGCRNSIDDDYYSDEIISK